MLDHFEPPKPVHDLPLRFPVQDVYRFDERRIIAGRIEAGTLRVGDTLVFSPEQQDQRGRQHRGLAGADEATSRSPGNRIGITLTEQIFVERGHVASHEHDAPIESNRFKARLFWMGKRNLADRRALQAEAGHAGTRCGGRFASRKSSTPRTLENVAEGRDYIARNDVAEITIQTRGALVMDNADRNALLGRFVIVDQRHVAGGGIIFGGVYTDRTQVKSQNIFWSEGTVTPAQARPAQRPQGRRRLAHRP